MPEQRVAPVAVLVGVACCAATAHAPVALGGVALASLGRFGLVSATTLTVVVAVAWAIDHRRALAEPDEPIEETL